MACKVLRAARSQASQVSVEANRAPGCLGFGGGPAGPGVRGIGAGGPNTVPSNPVGVYGQGAPQSPGVVGQAGAAPADGVQGFASGANSGVAGFGGDDSGSGVFGLGGGPAGPGVRGIGAGGPITPSDPSAGVYGQGGPQSSGVVGHGGDAPAGMTGFGGTGVAGAGGQPVGTGVFGIGNVGVHAVTRGADGDTAVLAASGPNGIGIFASGGEAGFFAGDVATAPGNLTVEGNLSVTGAKSAVVPFPDGSHRQLYCMESPESWFEDFGFGHLTDGQTSILLDRDFATTINTDSYHVFITEYDDHNGLFVTNRTSTGFEVRAKTSMKEVAFSYRVVTRRKDIAAARLAKVDLPTSRLEEIKARLAKVRVETPRAMVPQR
jgi:hypothetical protein